MKKASNTKCRYQLSWAIMVDNKLKSMMIIELDCLSVPKTMLKLGLKVPVGESLRKEVDRLSGVEA